MSNSDTTMQVSQMPEDLPQLLPTMFIFQSTHAEDNNNIFLVMVIGLDFVVDDNTPGPLSASKTAIDTMPRTIVEEAVEDCAICLEEIGVGCVLRQMPCKHGFHSGCIEKWLGIHGSCPICRYTMPVDE